MIGGLAMIGGAAAIKVSLVVLAGLAVARLLRNQPAALRHWVLAAAIACAVAVPVLPLVVPGWDVRPMASAVAQQVQAPETTLRTAATEASSTPRALPGLLAGRLRTSTAVRLVGLVWVTGTGISLFVLFVGFCRLAWLASRAERLRHGRWIDLAEDISRRCGVRSRVVILQSDHPSLLVTWGLLHPKVMLPAAAKDWPDDRVRVVLCHELAHIRRGDWAAQVIAELLRSAHWFNPLVWIASRRLREASEHACDDAVLNLGVEGPEYATHLLDIARAARNHRTGLAGCPAPAMVRSSTLERRVTAMLNTRLNRNPPTRSARLVATIGLITLTVLIAGFGAAAQSFATFSGSVVDPSNSIVPQVTVVLTNVQSQAKHEVRSDQMGQFEFVGLPAGDYALEARFPGFATLTGTLTVAGQRVQRNLALQVGSLSETITVSGLGAGTAPRVAGQPRKGRGLEGCSASSTGGNIRPPWKLLDVRPVYPPHLQAAGVEGILVLDARIGVDGFIRDVTVRQPSNSDLASAAVEAVRQWQFDATLLNCVPVEVPMTVTINFTGGQ